jgi:hypothetical protein
MDKIGPNTLLCLQVYFWYGFHLNRRRICLKIIKINKKYVVNVFNAQVGREGIFKPKIKNENLYEISNDKGVRVINLPYPKICHKYSAPTW